MSDGEFAINSSINATTGYAPFKLNHVYIPRSGQHISTDTTFKAVKQFAQQAVWNLLDVHDANSNKCHKPGVEYVGLYRNVRIIDLNLSVGITNPRRLNLIFIPSVTVKHCILYKFTLIFIYIFYK